MFPNEFKQPLRNHLIRIFGVVKSPPLSDDSPIYRFITYHKIKPHQEEKFKKQIEFLDQNYNIVSPEDFVKRKGNTNCLNLLLTFDDGYRSWEEIALPTLDEHNLRGIFFVCPDLVGLKTTEASSFCKDQLNMEPVPVLSEPGLHKLRQHGHTIGNHLIQHRDLRMTPDQAIINKSFQQSQTLFEERFNFKPKWLAYPYGDYFTEPQRLVKAAKKHFTYATTLIPGWNDSDTSRYFLHRDGFSPDLPPDVQKAWLSGGFDPIFQLTHTTRRTRP